MSVNALVSVVKLAEFDLDYTTSMDSTQFLSLCLNSNYTKCHCEQIMLNVTLIRTQDRNFAYW